MTEANERRVFTGATDVPLSENGRLALIQRAGMYPEASLFFTSGMLRARQTLEILYGPVESIMIPSLGEYRFGTFEGRSHEDLDANEPLYREWLKPGQMDIVCPGGESMRTFEARVTEGFRALLAHEWEGRAVLVSHGGAIGCVMRVFATGGEPVGVAQNGCGWTVCIEGRDHVVGYEAFS